MIDSNEILVSLKSASKVEGVRATVEQSQAYFFAKLASECDPSDVEHDVTNRVAGVVVVDARSPESYGEGHIPTAINLHHGSFTEADVEGLDRDCVYVTYGFGADCNAGTKGAAKLAALGFRVKEMIGGFEYWKRDGYPVETA